MTKKQTQSTFRKVTSKDFKGKTIKSVYNRCSNLLRFTFTDGSKLEVYSEPTSLGLAIMGVWENSK